MIRKEASVSLEYSCYNVKRCSFAIWSDDHGSSVGVETLFPLQWSEVSHTDVGFQTLLLC